MENTINKKVTINSEIMNSKRFILRHVLESDLNDIFKNYANDDEVTKFLTWNTHKSIEDTKFIYEIWQNQSDELKKYNFFIELKENHEIIGNCCVNSFIEGNPEIGYVLGKKWRNQGIMTEACTLLIEKLKTDGYSKIVINANAKNFASIRVIEKMGFKFVKQEKVFLSLKNKEILCNFYELNV